MRVFLPVNCFLNNILVVWKTQNSFAHPCFDVACTMIVVNNNPAIVHDNLKSPAQHRSFLGVAFFSTADWGEEECGVSDAEADKCLPFLPTMSFLFWLLSHGFMIWHLVKSNQRAFWWSCVVRFCEVTCLCCLHWLFSVWTVFGELLNELLWRIWLMTFVEKMISMLVSSACGIADDMFLTIELRHLDVAISRQINEDWDWTQQVVDMQWKCQECVLSTDNG